MQMTIDLSQIPIFNDHQMTTKTGEDTIAITWIKTPLGDMLAGATHQGICLLEYSIPVRLKQQLPRLEKTYGALIQAGFSDHFAPLQQQLFEYFSHKRKNFDLPLDIRGTEFQKQAWSLLQTIPYGETRCYQQQAIAIHRPKAIRAVASANGKNWISIIIPCHRVIGKRGSMSGYGGEIWRKEYLLKLERECGHPSHMTS